MCAARTSRRFKLILTSSYYSVNVHDLSRKQSGTHCSSPRPSCLRSRSGCHTSSGRGCSCYSRSGIHEVRRSFHLFHQEQTNTKMKTASKSMNINTALAITSASSGLPDTEFETRCTLEANVPDCATNPNKRVTGSWQNRRFCEKTPATAAERRGFSGKPNWPCFTSSET